MKILGYALGALIGIALMGAVIAVASIIEGFCLQILWGWFVVPLGVKEITIPLAIGLSLVAHILTHQHIYKPKETAEDKWAPVWKVFAGPLLALLIGYVVKLFL